MSEPSASRLLAEADQAMALALERIKAKEYLDEGAWMQVRRLYDNACALPNRNGNNGGVHEALAVLASYHAIAIFQMGTRSWHDKYDKVEDMLKLVTGMLSQEHANETKVQLYISCALLESLLGHPESANNAGKGAAQTALCMDDTVRGSIWLLRAELGPAADYRWALNQSLRFFSAYRQNDMAVLLELRARLQLAKYSTLNITARLWHQWQATRLYRQADRLHIGADRRSRVLESKLVWTFMPFDA